MKRLGVAVALLAAIAAGALALAWWQRAALAQWWLEREVAARGVEPAAFRVTSFETTGIAIEAITAGDPTSPDLAAERVEADWTTDSLRGGRFTALRVKGASLRARADDAGFSMGALDALLKGGAAAAGALSLPAPEITLEDARVEVATPRGPATGTLAGSIHERDGAIEGSFALDLAGAGQTAKGTLALGGTLGLPSVDLDLDAKLGASAIALDLSGRRVEGDALVLDASSVRVAGSKLSFRGARVDRDGMSLDALAIAKGRAKDVAVERLEAKWSLDSLRAGRVDALAVRGATVRVRFDDDGLSLGAAEPFIALAASPEKQAAKRDAKELPIGSVQLERVRIEVATAGAVLAVDRARFDPREKRSAIPVRVEKLDLEGLLALATVDGLAGTGALAGEIPIVWEGGALRVEGGALRAEGGTIRYEPSASVQNLAASRPSDLGIAIEAFSDFHYELLEASVDGDLEGALAIGLHVRGANPAFENGRSVELNLNLESHLADLVRSEAAAYRVPERIEERIRETSEGR